MFKLISAPLIVMAVRGCGQDIEKGGEAIQKAVK